MPIHIRLLDERDARAFLVLSQKIMSETPFMLRLPEEITMTVAQQAERIWVASERGIHLMLVAEQNGVLGRISSRSAWGIISK